MQWVTCHSGRLLRGLQPRQADRRGSFQTSLPDWDAIAPQGKFVCGAIHELLSKPDHPQPIFAAMVLAKSIATDGARMGTDKKKNSNNLCPSVPHLWQQNIVIWCDPAKQIYPPALSAQGIALDRFYLLHPKSPADEMWGMTECLRCKGVSATIASPKRLSRLEARRLQLAAEQGGGVGILLRRLDRSADIYSAVTRWLVEPMPGERRVQKWKIQLIHGHGGQVGSSFILEKHRDRVRTTAQLADRPMETKLRLAV